MVRGDARVILPDGRERPQQATIVVSSECLVVVSLLARGFVLFPSQFGVYFITACKINGTRTYRLNQDTDTRRRVAESVSRLTSGQLASAFRYSQHRCEDFACV